MLEKKVEESFFEATKLLKTDKSKLVNELKSVGKQTGGEKIKKLEILGKLLNILGEKKPVSFQPIILTNKYKTAKDSKGKLTTFNSKRLGTHNDQNLD